MDTRGSDDARPDAGPTTSHPERAMTKFGGRNQLLDRLAHQTGNRDMAKQILMDRGHMHADGSLTAAGRIRDNMTAAERAMRPVAVGRLPR